METPYRAMHFRAETKEQRDLMRGSKYIQSSLGDTFRSIKADLDSGLEVLFSGAPCQVSGLRNYFGKDYKNLLCVDILCHGVPSPKVWKAFVEWNENNNSSKVYKVNFRDKSLAGWRDHIETLSFSNGCEISSKIFTRIIYEHNSLRKSCYHCPFKNLNRVYFVI